MAYFRCSGGNNGDGGIIPPKGKVLSGTTYYDYADGNFSVSTLGGLRVFNGEDLEGKSMTIKNSSTKDINYYVRCVKSGDTGHSYSAKLTSASPIATIADLSGFDLVTVQCACGTSNSGLQLSFTISAT